MQGTNMKLLLLLALVGAMLLTGCRKEPGEPAKDPGSFFPSYPCITCADGTLYCSDVHKDHC